MPTKFYWNMWNGVVEFHKNKDNCPIVKSINDDIVVESWWVDNSHESIIDFAYSRNLPYDRDLHFSRHNVHPQELRMLIIPKSEYEDLEREYEN